MKNINSSKFITNFANNKQFDIDNRYRFDINDNNTDLRFFEDKDNQITMSLNGHIINDYSSILCDTINKKKLKQKIVSYLIDSQKNNCYAKYNCENKTIPVIASKKINKDDKILMSYSPEYWLSEKQEYI